jgi:hypothetical protein
MPGRQEAVWQAVHSGDAVLRRLWWANVLRRTMCRSRHEPEPLSIVWRDLREWALYPWRVHL